MTEEKHEMNELKFDLKEEIGNSIYSIYSKISADSDFDGYLIIKKHLIKLEEAIKSELSAAEKRGEERGWKAKAQQVCDYCGANEGVTCGHTYGGYKNKWKTLEDWRNSSEYKSGAKADGK